MKRINTDKRVLFFFILFSLILQSCSKAELISLFYFETTKDADSMVFAVIGDFGKEGEAEEKVAKLVKSWDPDFIITTGDNNYERGEYHTLKANISNYYGDYIYNFDAPEEFQCNGKAFKEKVNRFFPSPGNHDANNSEGLIPYLNFFTLPAQETFYKFVWGSVSFYSLNSVATNIEEQKEWLYEQLNLSESPFNIVYFHHPPYSPGLHGNDEKMQWDYFGNDVDMVLSGHDHIYSRIEKRGEEGLYYIVNGLGGKSIYNRNSNPLPVDLFDTFSFDADYGAMKATATSKELVVEFYSIGQAADPIDRIIIGY